MPSPTHKMQNKLHVHIVCQRDNICVQPSSHRKLPSPLTKMAKRCLQTVHWGFPIHPHTHTRIATPPTNGKCDIQEPTGTHDGYLAAWCSHPVGIAQQMRLNNRTKLTCPVSHKQVTTVWPGPIFLATWTAAETFKPEDAPTKNPSSHRRRKVCNITNQTQLDEHARFPFQAFSIHKRSHRTRFSRLHRLSCQCPSCTTKRLALGVLSLFGRHIRCWGRWIHRRLRIHARNRTSVQGTEQYKTRSNFLLMGTFSSSGQYQKSSIFTNKFSQSGCVSGNHLSRQCSWASGGGGVHQQENSVTEWLSGSSTMRTKSHRTAFRRAA